MPFASFDIETQNALSTTDATPTTILNAEMPADSSALFFLLVIAKSTTNGATRNWALIQPRKRVGVGNATVVGSAADLLPSSADSGTAGWALSVSSVGDRINMQVTGAAGTTINWYAKISGMSLQ